MSFVDKINKITAEAYYGTIPIVWPTTTAGVVKLTKLDATFLGTDDYMGIAPFWGQAFKHALRDISSKMKKKAHDALRKADLPLDGETNQHAAILKKLKIY